jgi:hypothetical protein
MRSLAVLAVALAPAWALADEGDPPSGDAEPYHPRIGVSLHLASGARALFPYDGEYCGSAGAYCLGRAPARTDLGASVRLSRSIDFLATLQLGIERDFGASASASGPRLLAVAPGILARLSESEWIRVAATAQLVIDGSRYEQARGPDYAFRNENRLMIKLAELGGGAVLSGYGFFAETVGFRRWLRFELEAGAGVLARF